MSDLHVDKVEGPVEVQDPAYLSWLLSQVEIVHWNLPQKKGPQGDEVQSPNSAFFTTSTKCQIPVEASKALSSIFPPVRWTDGSGDQWIQTISERPTTRLEAAELRADVKVLAMKAQARPRGICPIRINIISRCFDELIRLTAIDEAQRGLMLRAIRDELRMSLHCWKTLISSASSTPASSTSERPQSVELRDELSRLQRERDMTRYNNFEAQRQMALFQRQTKDKRAALEKYRADKIQAVKRACDQYIAILEAVGADKSQYRHLL